MATPWAFAFDRAPCRPQQKARIAVEAMTAVSSKFPRTSLRDRTRFQIVPILSPPASRAPKRLRFLPAGRYSGSRGEEQDQARSHKRPACELQRKKLTS